MSGQDCHANSLCLHIFISVHSQEKLQLFSWFECAGYDDIPAFLQVIPHEYATTVLELG